MNRVTGTVLLVAATSVLAAPGAATAPGQAEGSRPDGRGRVLLIGIDGVRPDVMASVATPHLDSLIAAGAFSDAARTTRQTVSGPAWSSMLTGVWPERHGVFNNSFVENRYADYPDFLTRIEQTRAELNTFAAADWLPLVADDAGGPLIGGTVDRVVALDGYEVGWLEGDRMVVDSAVAELSMGDPHAMFVYLGNPDETSHRSGSIGAEYRAAIEEADARVGHLMAALRRRPRYAEENWLVLVSTDHGRRPNGGHGGLSEAELRIFFLAAGPAVAPGSIEGTPRIPDVAATALAHVGIDPAGRTDALDGRVVGLGGAPADRDAGAEPLTLRTADGVTIFGERYGDPTNARALILLFHQGGANGRAEYAPLVPRLLRNAYAAVAIDQRAGGDFPGGKNRTRAALGSDPHYCEALPDLEAALAHAREIAGELPIIVWGSSYSGALAMKLASDHPEAIRGVLAFSPADGEAMEECPATRFAAGVTRPMLVLYPVSEQESERDRAQTDELRRRGVEVFVAEPGVHGSSMLNPERVEGDVEPAWQVVLEFLSRLSAGS